ncbi:hypothetical protein NDU88_005536 [Pleurodeles waltl]|uniref:Uncharacterized protein n=1 Tax=Pleurodeles waltl TaxID=8319 RepID=A0AAV7L3B4_PLEWA|nr:hypothetical protein NDU88_005536 [Pleurodeles waltl]
MRNTCVALLLVRRAEPAKISGPWEILVFITCRKATRVSRGGHVEPSNGRSPYPCEAGTRQKTSSTSSSVPVTPKNKSPVDGSVVKDGSVDKGGYAYISQNSHSYDNSDDELSHDEHHLVDDDNGLTVNDHSDNHIDNHFVDNSFQVTVDEPCVSDHDCY